MHQATGNRQLEREKEHIGARQDNSGTGNMHLIHLIEPERMNKEQRTYIFET